MDELAQKKLKSFCRDLARRVQRYYADEEHRKEFEEWYFKKYGKQYVWKRRSGIRREKYGTEDTPGTSSQG